MPLVGSPILLPDAKPSLFNLTESNLTLDSTPPRPLITSLCKRKSSSVNEQSDSGNLSDSSSNASDDENECVPRKKKKVAVVEVPVTAVRPPPLAFPKSLYHGHEPTLPRMPEMQVLQKIIVSGATEPTYFETS